MSRVGDAIRAERERAGMYGNALADASSFSPQYVSDIERGRRLPTTETLLAITSVLTDMDSAAALWLLLRDLWGDPVADVMWRYAVMAEAKGQPS